MVPWLAGAILVVVLAVAAMAILSPVLTLVAAAVLPALWWRSRRAQRELFPANWDAPAAGRACSSAGSRRPSPACGWSRASARRPASSPGWSESARRLFASRLRTVRLQARFEPALRALPAFGQVGVLLLGGWLALHGHISLGTFLAFSAYLVQLVGATEFLTEMLLVGPWPGPASSGSTICCACRADVRTRADPVDLPRRPPRGGVRRRHLRLRCTGARRAEPARSPRARPSPSSAPRAAASRRSSRCSRRFYDPAGGSVRVGGVDVRRAAHRRAAAQHRRRVRGEPAVLRHVAGNIAYGRPDADRAEVEARRRGRRGRRLHPGPARRLRHGGRRAGADALRRAAAAARDRAGAARRAPAAGAGRRHVRRRPAGGGPDQRPPPRRQPAGRRC